MITFKLCYLFGGGGIILELKIGGGGIPILSFLTLGNILEPDIGGGGIGIT
jgi:hypothetical protein